jgi:hypothetical protein
VFYAGLGTLIDLAATEEVNRQQLINRKENKHRKTKKCKVLANEI